MTLGAFDDLCIANAQAALDTGDVEAAAQWLAALSKSTTAPAALVARCADGMSRFAAGEGNWLGAVASAARACSVDRTAWRQERLALLRARRDLLSAREMHVIEAAAPAPGRLRPDSLRPEIGTVHACGAYYSRGHGAQAPWSKYLRLSKEPPFEDEERRAIFRLAAGYFATYVLAATDLLRRAEVVVPVPANPERYTRRLASLPDELASACQAMLALKSIRFAIAWDAESVHVEMKRLNHRDRRQVAPSVFVPGPEAAQIAGRGVLLVDDLTTTGSTLRACARVLSDLGAHCIDACALAHTEG